MRLAQRMLATLRFLVGCVVAGAALLPSASALAQKAPGRPLAGPACSEGWLRRVHAAYAGAIARVESVSGRASGFVLGSADRVVTTYEAVSFGRPVVVYLADGRRHRARVVAVSKEDNLALLALDTPDTEVRPLELAPQPAELGATVAVLADGGSNAENPKGVVASITPGVVTAQLARRFQFSIALPQSVIGGAAVDCEGRVVGMAGGERSVGSVAATLESIRTLRERGAALKGTWRGGWRPGLSAELIMQVAPEVLGGAALGVSATWADRLTLSLRLGLLTGDLSGSTLLSTQRMDRMYGELLASWRHPLVRGEAPLYFTAGLGLAIGKDWLTTSTLSLRSENPQCAPGTSALCYQSETATGRVTVLPSVTAGLWFGRVLNLSYTFRLDPDKLSAPVHQLSFGVVF